MCVALEALAISLYNIIVSLFGLRSIHKKLDSDSFPFQEHSYYFRQQSNISNLPRPGHKPSDFVGLTQRIQHSHVSPHQKLELDQQHRPRARSSEINYGRPVKDFPVQDQSLRHAAPPEQVPWIASSAGAAVDEVPDFKCTDESESSDPHQQGGIRASMPLIRLNQVVITPSEPNFRKQAQKLEENKVVSDNPSIPVQSMDIRALNLEQMIGGGAFGQVWKGTWNGTPVAVKVLSAACQQRLSDQLIESFKEEVMMLARLRHPNICLFLGACLDPPHRAIVTELVSRGSLWDVLRTSGLFPGHSGPSHWPAATTRKVLDSTLCGLVYLHKHDPPIIHRDLKSANLLIDDSFNVKICDFGLARLRDVTNVMTANVGTAQWMAPEVLMGKSYTESADMFSFGIIVWEVLTGLCPLDGMAPMEVAMAVTQRGVRPPLPHHCAPALRRLVESCWAPIPATRLTADAALRDLQSAMPLPPAGP